MLKLLRIFVIPIPSPLPFICSTSLLVCVAILLGSVRLKYEEIRRLVLLIDEQVLTNQMINSMLKFLPSSEEVELIDIS